MHSIVTESYQTLLEATLKDQNKLIHIPTNPGWTCCCMPFLGLSWWIARLGWQKLGEETVVVPDNGSYIPPKCWE